MDKLILIVLFGLALLFALLCGFARRGRGLWFVLSGLAAVAVVLAGLALGRSLDELLLPLLALSAAVLLPLLRRREDGDEL